MAVEAGNNTLASREQLSLPARYVRAGILVAQENALASLRAWSGVSALFLSEAVSGRLSPVKIWRRSLGLERIVEPPLADE